MHLETPKCYGDKIRQQHIKSPSHEPGPPAVDSSQSRTHDEQRYAKMRCLAPEGFHELLQKIIREVVLCRPAHVYRFIADLLDIELAQRTFDDIMYSCMLKKSQKMPQTESCRLRTSFIEQTQMVMLGSDQFTMGPIPDYDLEKPALDRYRDFAGIGVFDMTCCEHPPEPCDTAALQPPECKDEKKAKEAPPPGAMVFDKGPIPQYALAEPALDRYRDYAGIEPFALIGDECNDHAPLCT